MRLPQLCALIGLTCVVLGSREAIGEDRYPVRQLTSNPAQEGFPYWSPDGSCLVFSSGAVEDTIGLWIVSADGAGRRRLTTEIGEHPTWSADGRYIVFDGDSGNSIKIVSASGGTPIRIVPDSIDIVRGGNPNWSPDASSIAFEGGGTSLQILNLSRGTVRTLFVRDSTIIVPCCWSRNGNEIYFWLRPPNTRLSALWAVTLTGESREILPLTPGRAYRYADLSPDGSMIAYTACEGRACDIWVMPTDGGPAVPLTTHPALDEAPRWSPDGTKIAFTSTRSQSFDVWVMDLDLPDLRSALGLPVVTSP